MLSILAGIKGSDTFGNGESLDLLFRMHALIVSTVSGHGLFC